MMRVADWLFVLGAGFFAGGGLLVLRSMETGASSRHWLGLGSLGAAVACLLVGAWRRLTRVDWDRVAAEQRLWRSGPLGRAWLKSRKNLLDDGRSRKNGGNPGSTLAERQETPMTDPSSPHRDLDELRAKLLKIFADAEAGPVALPDGTTITVDRNAPDGAEVRLDGDGAVFRRFAAADERPRGYPPDLPFLPGLDVHVSQVSDGLVALHWFVVPDPATLRVEVESLLQREGWERTEVQQVLPTPPVTTSTFSKAGTERILVSGGPGAMLLQEKKRT